MLRMARTNRFFAMVRVCRKVCLAVLLDACSRLYPEHYLARTKDLVGRPCLSRLGGDSLEDHRRHCADQEAQRASEGHTAFIVKPDNGCQRWHRAGLQP